ncbi:hypothetical protein Q7P36_002911 [Cladosporium allicinum]
MTGRTIDEVESLYFVVNHVLAVISVLVRRSVLIPGDVVSTIPSVSVPKVGVTSSAVVEVDDMGMGVIPGLAKGSVADVESQPGSQVNFVVGASSPGSRLDSEHLSNGIGEALDESGTGRVELLVSSDKAGVFESGIGGRGNFVVEIGLPEIGLDLDAVGSEIGGSVDESLTESLDSLVFGNPIEDVLVFFGTGLCVAETVFLVVVELASTELENTETTFEVVELATDIDEDDSSLLLGPLATRLCIVELLLLVMLGCITIEMDVDSGAVEFVTTADVCPASEETNVVVFEAGDGVKSVGLEVEGTKFVAFELLPFPETLDLKVIAKEPELDPVDAIAEFDETEIGLGREAPEPLPTITILSLITTSYQLRQPTGYVHSSVSSGLKAASSGLKAIPYGEIWSAETLFASPTPSSSPILTPTSTSAPNMNLHTTTASTHYDFPKHDEWRECGGRGVLGRMFSRWKRHGHAIVSGDLARRSSNHGLLELHGIITAASDSALFLGVTFLLIFIWLK